MSDLSVIVVRHVAEWLDPKKKDPRLWFELPPYEVEAGEEFVPQTPDGNFMLAVMALMQAKNCLLRLEDQGVTSEAQVYLACFDADDGEWEAEDPNPVHATIKAADAVRLSIEGK